MCITGAVSGSEKALEAGWDSVAAMRTQASDVVIKVGVQQTWADCQRLTLEKNLEITNFFVAKFHVLLALKTPSLTPEDLSALLRTLSYRR